MENTATECQIHMYADDVTLYCCGSDIEEISAKLNNSLCIAHSWFRQNRLLINPDKSKCMLIGTKGRTASKQLKIQLNNKEISECSTVKLLGVHIDNDLKWRTHTEELAKQMNSRLFLYRRLCEFIPRSLMATLYHSLFQSKFDYCLTLWGSCALKNLNLLQRIQNRAARIITKNFDRDVNSVEIVGNLGWMTMEQRFKYFVLLLTYKCVNNFAPVYLTNMLTAAQDEHFHATRLAITKGFTLPRIKTEYYKGSFRYQAAKLWNSLPSNLRCSSSVNSFKQRLKSFILKND